MRPVSPGAAEIHRRFFRFDAVSQSLLDRRYELCESHGGAA